MPSHLAATEAAAYATKPPPPRKNRLRRAAPDSAPAPGRSPSAPEDERADGGLAGSTAQAEPQLPPLDDLVAGINAVGFAPGAADEAQADRAGRQAVAYADALRARRSWWRRMWWSVRPGPLRWRRDP
jgi:hypothetical protein